VPAYAAYRVKNMFSWMNKDGKRTKEPEIFATVSDGLKKLYKTKMLPLEEFYKCVALNSFIR